MTSNNNTKSAEIVIPGSICMGIIFFIIGLLVYQDFFQALMLGLFAWLMTIITIIYIVPYAGIALFILTIWVWKWPETIGSVLGLPVDGLTVTALFLPGLVYFTIGVAITIGISIPLFSVIGKEVAVKYRGLKWKIKVRRAKKEKDKSLTEVAEENIISRLSN